MTCLLADGSNIPDEFIVEILKANSNDLNKSYEELLQRLERKIFYLLPFLLSPGLGSAVTCPILQVRLGNRLTKRRKRSPKSTRYSDEQR